MSKSVILPMVVMLFVISGCTVFQSAKIAEKAAEPVVDAAYEKTISRLCNLPLDIQMRAIDRHGPAMVTGMVALCPSWRGIRDAMLSNMATQMGYDLTPGIASPKELPAWLN